MIRWSVVFPYENGKDCQNLSSVHRFSVLDFCFLCFTWFCCSLHWNWSVFILSTVKVLRTVSSIWGKMVLRRSWEVLTSLGYSFGDGLTPQSLLLVFSIQCDAKFVGIWNCFLIGTFHKTESDLLENPLRTWQSTDCEDGLGGGSWSVDHSVAWSLSPETDPTTSKWPTVTLVEYSWQFQT